MSATRRGAGGSVRPRRWRTRFWVAGGLAAALAAGGGAAAYALWSDGALYAGGTITAGNLDLQRAAEPSWEQVTPGVAEADRASGTWPDDSGFVAMPGDVIETSIPVATVLKGDNLEAGFTVDYALLSNATENVVSGFYVTDAEGNRIAPLEGDASFGEVLEVPGLVGTDAGATDDWIVVVTTRIVGDYAWEGEGEDLSSTWDAGSIEVSLDQVRTDGGTS